MIVVASCVATMMPDLVVAANSTFGAVFLHMTATATIEHDGTIMDHGSGGRSQGLS